MLRRTHSLQAQYHSRFVEYPWRRNKPRYLMPQWAHRKSPMAHKQPEEYKNTWDSRAGIEWHNRLKHRGVYRHWPWVRWTDDFLRHHKSDDTFARTFSARAKARGGQLPLWNHYSEVGEHYGLPLHAPVASLTDVMHKYVGKTWSRSDLDGFFAAFAAAGWETIEALHEGAEAVHRWNDGCQAVPRGFLQHALLLAEDVCHQCALQGHRIRQHERGILRTREMERYFAMPYLRGPAMPTTRAQLPGIYPVGRYLIMMKSPFHPLQYPDSFTRRSRYPA